MDTTADADYPGVAVLSATDDRRRVGSFDQTFGIPGLNLVVTNPMPAARDGR
jgi:hypothetical protein